MPNIVEKLKTTVSFELRNASRYLQIAMRFSGCNDMLFLQVIGTQIHQDCGRTVWIANDCMEWELIVSIAKELC